MAPARQATSAKGSCPVFRPGQPTGRLESKEIDEASGLVAGRANPGVLWVHNDSGDDARLFALKATGKLLGVYTLPTVRAIDWEDIAIGPGKDTDEPHLYVGDIGDNTRRRKAGIIIHRVAEPKLVTARKAPTKSERTGGKKASPGDPQPPSEGETSEKKTQPALERRLGPLETFRLKYPTGPRDAETLLVEPKTGEVVLLTKALFSSSEIYYASALEKPVTRLEGGELLDEIAPQAAGLLPTGGDVSRDGRWVVVRSYSTAYLWTREPDRPLHEVFASPACTIPLAKETQGEAIGFSHDGKGYATVSEGAHATLFFYSLVP